MSERMRQTVSEKISVGQFIVATILLCSTLTGGFFGLYSGLKSEIVAGREQTQSLASDIALVKERVTTVEKTSTDQALVIKQNGQQFQNISERLIRIETLVTEKQK